MHKNPPQKNIVLKYPLRIKVIISKSIHIQTEEDMMMKQIDPGKSG